VEHQITYTPDEQRFKSTLSRYGSTTTRYYMPDFEKYVNSVGGEQYYTYLRDGSMSAYNRSSLTRTFYHGYYDAQGSLIALTDSSGNVLARYAYDPWGKRVKPTDWTQGANAPTVLNLKRGYTMHEHLDEFDLINMNGRVYDPAVAQFLSPDPYIQDAGNWLNYNRYAYCYNNPTRYVDPSGEVIVALVSDFLYTLCSGGLNFNKSIRQNTWKRFDPSAPWSITNQSSHR
jgi:RHS repeat-associated protein